MAIKRLLILIEEELDDALAHEAAKQGTSKTAVVRRYVREELMPLPPLDPTDGNRPFAESQSSRSIRSTSRHE